MAAFRQAVFGRKSEKRDPEQFELALEDIEAAIASVHAEEDADVPARNEIPVRVLPIAEICPSICLASKT